MKLRQWSLAAALGAAVLSTGCASVDRRDAATVGGAAVGGVVGNRVLGGTLGTVGGAAAGGVIGNQLGRDRDRR